MVTIGGQASAFSPGAGSSIDLQWTPGQIVGLFVGTTELNPPVIVPGLGRLVLDPGTAFAYGVAITSPQGVAQVPYQLPSSPSIVGLRIGMQGVALTTTGALILSTFQAMTPR